MSERTNSANAPPGKESKSSTTPISKGGKMRSAGAAVPQSNPGYRRGGVGGRDKWAPVVWRTRLALHIPVGAPVVASTDGGLIFDPLAGSP